MKITAVIFFMAADFRNILSPDLNFETKTEKIEFGRTRIREKNLTPIKYRCVGGAVAI